LASCGGGGVTGVTVGPGGLMLPDCKDGQLIGVDASKNLSCVSALSGMLSPPACLPGTQALTSTKDPVTGVVSLSCINKGTGTNDMTTETRITNATNSVNNLVTKLTMIQSGGGIRSKYVGHSTNATVGLIQSGNSSGIHAANLICANDLALPTAHMCTPFEIYESVVTAQPGDKLDGSADVGPYWVYLEGWNDPSTSVNDALAGLNENCGSYTYKTHDHAWDGMTFLFQAWTGGPGVRVPRFNTGAPAQYCSASFQIACCN
jgi:hypothetical protein